MEIDASKQKLVSGFTSAPPPETKPTEPKKQPELDPASYPAANGAGLATYFKLQASLPSEVCEGSLKEAGKSLGDKFGVPVGIGIGTAIGSKAGPKGAAVGAAVGGFLGGVFGKTAGEIAGKQVAKAICPTTQPTPLQATPKAVPSEPDAGGPVIVSPPASTKMEPTAPMIAPGSASVPPKTEPSFTHVDPSKNKSG